MTTMQGALLERLDAVERRLDALAARDDRLTGLTAADPATGEQWEAGQVWAHLAELVGYWLEQARRVIETRSPDPTPFGRVKSNPERIAAIERDRATAVATLSDRVRQQIGAARQFLHDREPRDWEARGLHQAQGVMTLERIMEEFVVGHLEQHAEQLEGLARADGG